MLTDARSIAADQTLQADICIVGAGVAGISIAREFIGRPESVVLLESGGLEFTRSFRNLPTVVRRHPLQEQALSAGTTPDKPTIRSGSQGCARSVARRGHGTTSAVFTPVRSTR